MRTNSHRRAPHVGAHDNRVARSYELLLVGQPGSQAEQVPLVDLFINGGVVIVLTTHLHDRNHVPVVTQNASVYFAID